MSQMSVKDAVKIALGELNSLSAHDLREELAKHAAGPLSVALNETSQFLAEFNQSTTTSNTATDSTDL